MRRDSVWNEEVRKTGGAQENLRVKLNTSEQIQSQSQTHGGLCADQRAEKEAGALSIWKGENQWHTAPWRPRLGGWTRLFQGLGPFALIIRVAGGESPGLPPVPGLGLPLGEKRIMPTWWLYLLRMLNSRTRC